MIWGWIWMPLFRSFSQLLYCLEFQCSIPSHFGSPNLRPLTPPSNKTVTFCLSFIPWITVWKLHSEKSHSMNIELTICASLSQGLGESCLSWFLANALKLLIYVCHLAFMVVLAGLLYHAWLRLEIPYNVFINRKFSSCNSWYTSGTVHANAW